MRRESNDFWRHSLHIYRRPEVQAACLALQDTIGADVNLLLYCCWIGHGGRSLARTELRRAITEVRRWQSEVIVPLRQTRRALKALAGVNPVGEWATPMRKRIGELELDAEYVEQRLLFDLSKTLKPRARKHKPSVATRTNLERYLALLPALPNGNRRADTDTWKEQLVMASALGPSPVMDSASPSPVSSLKN